MEQAPITVVLSPHHDDAVFSLGGLLSKHLGQQKIVTLFGGATPPAHLPLTKWNADSGFRSNVEAEASRAKENRDALRLLGLKDEEILDCGLTDEQYRANGETTKVVEEIRSVLAGSREHSMCVYAPITGWPVHIHADHVLVRDAMLAIAREGGHENAQFFLYDDVFPYVFNFLRQKPHSELKSEAERNLNLRLEQSIILLSKEDFDRKLASAGQYPSQLKVLSQYPLSETLREYSAKVLAESGLQAYACETVYRLVL